MIDKSIIDEISNTSSVPDFNLHFEQVQAKQKSPKKIVDPEDFLTSMKNSQYVSKSSKTVTPEVEVVKINALMEQEIKSSE